MEHIQFDFTKIGDHYLLVVIDCFTKHVWTKLFPTKQAPPVVLFLIELLKKEGKPSIWHSDNGGEFISDIMIEVAKELGIEIRHGRPNHPQSQGQVERVNKTLKNLVYQQLRENPERSLKEIIKHCTSLYNNTRIHESTGYTPFEVLRPAIAFSPPKLEDADLPAIRLQQALSIRKMYDLVSVNLESERPILNPRRNFKPTKIAHDHKAVP